MSSLFYFLKESLQRLHAQPVHGARLHRHHLPVAAHHRRVPGGRHHGGATCVKSVENEVSITAYVADDALPGVACDAVSRDHPGPWTAVANRQLHHQGAGAGELQQRRPPTPISSSQLDGHEPAARLHRRGACPTRRWSTRSPPPDRGRTTTFQHHLRQPRRPRRFAAVRPEARWTACSQ